MCTTIRITETPDVLHGKPRIEGTGIGVFSIGIRAREQGATVEELLDNHPDLDCAQVQAALDYYDEHPELIEYIQTQKEAMKKALSDQSRAPAAGFNGDS